MAETVATGNLLVNAARRLMDFSVMHIPCSRSGRDWVCCRNSSRPPCTNECGQSEDSPRERPMGVAFTCN